MNILSIYSLNNHKRKKSAEQISEQKEVVAQQN